MDDILKEFQPWISAITEIEQLCWKTANENDLSVLQSFVADSIVLELERDTKVKTVVLRKNHKIKFPDAIIAATAIANGLTLLTRNVSDFQAFSDLSFINPWDK